ncbi:MAG: ROK family protein [Oscillospiraceae bacterium]|nr:ROK family protein [Oscillospiraceae bacterium]
MYIGIDVGGTKCALIAAEKEGEGCRMMERIAFPTGSLSEALEKFYEGIEKLIAKYGSCEGIGISCGGPLNERTGMILSPPNLPGWDEVPIVKMMEERFGVPTKLRNDANACALAEWRFGAGQGTTNMVFLTCGTGMGAGLILNGQLYAGTDGNAGEVGHIRLAEYGPSGYGKSGSFEGFCSGGGIALVGQMLAREKIQQGHPTAFCPTLGDLPSITAKMLAEYANAGDETALEVWRIVGEKLGQGISIIIDMLNPEVIVIGSVYARSGELMREAMEKVIKREALFFSADACRIVPAALGDQIGDYAAVAAAME